MSVYEQVRAYHAEHGDDVSERSRRARYHTISELIGEPRRLSLLDVGCGSGALAREFSYSDYTGIDLLDGQNVLDYHTQHDVVVANGIFYKLPDSDHAWQLIQHCWSLCREAFIFTSLSAWAPEHYEGELSLDPVNTVLRCYHLTPKLALRHDYLSHDFAVALYR